MLSHSAGTDPAEFREIARRELSRYPTSNFIDAE